MPESPRNCDSRKTSSRFLGTFSVGGGIWATSFFIVMPATETMQHTHMHTRRGVRKLSPYSEGKKVYTKGVFSSENSSASTDNKRGLVYTKNLVFKGKRRKIHIHQRAFKVFVGDPFAQYWCIDFGLLHIKTRKRISDLNSVLPLHR